MIRDLPHLISVDMDTIEDDLADQAEASALSLKELVEDLTSHEERCLAARVAYLVAAVSKQPRDRLRINVDEQRVIQELLQELNLSKDELKEIESLAIQELNQNRSPIKLVMDLIFGDKKLPDLLVEKLYAEGRHHPGHPLHQSYEGLTSNLKR